LTTALEAIHEPTVGRRAQVGPVDAVRWVVLTLPGFRLATQIMPLRCPANRPEAHSPALVSANAVTTIAGDTFARWLGRT
jgi:hypothetical protein